MGNRCTKRSRVSYSVVSCLYENISSGLVGEVMFQMMYNHNECLFVSFLLTNFIFGTGK